MRGEYEVKETILKKYLTIAAQLLTEFYKVQIKQLSMKDNTRADVLSKLASPVVIEQKGKFLLEYRDSLSYEAPQIFSLDQGEIWMGPIIRTSQGEESHANKQEIAKL
ncbi:hypothetical protein J1N35_011743 [Gossypium stocksii]|uniref:Uncharacterized protein n=1 Tax=Gossypium stocksii TaxID=47602 RepID=A0A9D3W4L6_9ROSI|nr:hypothetical protein J1N35_011743 [Gossypium stocksii]